MKHEELLGGYATGNLTEDEQTRLMEAALVDDELFAALVEEEGLRELLADPQNRAELLQVLPYLFRGDRPAALEAAELGNAKERGLYVPPDPRMACEQSSHAMPEGLNGYILQNTPNPTRRSWRSRKPLAWAALLLLGLGGGLWLLPKWSKHPPLQKGPVYLDLPNEEPAPAPPPSKAPSAPEQKFMESPSLAPKPQERESLRKIKKLKQEFQVINSLKFHWIQKDLLKLSHRGGHLYLLQREGRQWIVLQPESLSFPVPGTAEATFRIQGQGSLELFLLFQPVQDPLKLPKQKEVQGLHKRIYIP